MHRVIFPQPCLSLPASVATPREAEKTFFAFLHGDRVRLFSVLDTQCYKSNLQGILTLSAVPEAACETQPL